MKSLKYYFFLLLLITGCETNVTNVELPGFQQKLVIASFISPYDSVSYINVTSNRKIFGETGVDETTGKLSGSVSDGISEVLLDTLPGKLFFSHKKMQVNHGKTYLLKISSSKGLEAEATCTVPLKKEFVIEADTSSAIIQYGWGSEKSVLMKFTFQDIPGEENYYRIECRGYGYYDSGRGIMKGAIVFPFKKDLFSDKGMDGKNIVQSTDYRISYLSGSDSVFAVFYLYNTEKSYYLYHQSLHNYSDENPFAETTPVFSNVTGGLGVFTSYTVDSLVIRIK